MAIPVELSQLLQKLSSMIIPGVRHGIRLISMKSVCLLGFPRNAHQANALHHQKCLAEILDYSGFDGRGELDAD
jgi:hypothetical protein